MLGYFQALAENERMNNRVIVLWLGYKISRSLRNLLINTTKSVTSIFIL